MHQFIKIINISPSHSTTAVFLIAKTFHGTIPYTLLAPGGVSLGKTYF